MKTLRFLFPLFLLTLSLFVATSFAQKQDKKWSDWSKKEAEKMLTDSPWSQKQTDTDTSEMFYSPTNDSRIGGRVTSNGASRTAEGAVNSAVTITFHVRLFSARPVRQAHARALELQQSPPPDVVAKLQNWAELKSPDAIIITVTFDAPDQRYQNSVMQAFNSAVTGTLKNNTYLERSDGKRLFLEEYVPPGKDGFGARFIFLRAPNGQPFIENNNGEIHFFSQFPGSGKIDRRFKLANMMYQGELEY